MLMKRALGIATIVALVGPFAAFSTSEGRGGRGTDSSTTSGSSCGSARSADGSSGSVAAIDATVDSAANSGSSRGLGSDSGADADAGTDSSSGGEGLDAEDASSAEASGSPLDAANDSQPRITTCDGSSPVSCGQVGQACCEGSGGECASGAFCDSTTVLTGQCGTDCGGVGQPCCSLRECKNGGCCVDIQKIASTLYVAIPTCVNGGSCINGSIAACGRPGQACCSIPEDPGGLNPSFLDAFCTYNYLSSGACPADGICPGPVPDGGVEAAGCGAIGQPCCDVWEGVYSSEGLRFCTEASSACISSSFDLTQARCVAAGHAGQRCLTPSVGTTTLGGGMRHHHRCLRRRGGCRAVVAPTCGDE